MQIFITRTIICSWRVSIYLKKIFTKVSPNHWLADKAHHAGCFPLACPLFSRAEAGSGSCHFPAAECLLLCSSWLQREALVLWLPRLQYFMTHPKVKPRPWKNIWLFFPNNIIVLFFDPLRCTCNVLYLKSGCAQTEHKKAFKLKASFTGIWIRILYKLRKISVTRDNRIEIKRFTHNSPLAYLSSQMCPHFSACCS